MKAFMSNRWLQAERDSGAALAEARVILAESEQVSESADYYSLPCALWPSDLPRPTTPDSSLCAHVLANRAANAGTMVLFGQEAEYDLAADLASILPELDRLAQEPWNDARERGRVTGNDGFWWPEWTGSDWPDAIHARNLAELARIGG